MRLRQRLTAAVLTASLWTPTAAHAGGLAAPTVGPSNSGVSTNDPASIYHNPGGLGFVEGPRIILGGGLVIGDVRYRRERLATYQYSDSLDFELPIDQAAIDEEKTGFADEVRTHPVAVVPSLFAQIPLGDLPLSMGVGAYAPYAARLNLPESGAQRYQIIDAFIAASNVTAALAYRPIEQLSLGVGVSYVLGVANLTKVQDFAALSDLGEGLSGPPINQPNDFGPNADPAVRELDTMSRPFAFRRGWAHGATFNVGATAKVTNDLWLAASYTHSTQLDFKGTFKLDMSDPFFTQDLASQGLLYPNMVEGRATLSTTLPSVVRFGLRYDNGFLGDRPQTSLAVEVAYTRWSLLKSFDVHIASAALEQPELGLPDYSDVNIPRDFRDTYMGLVRLSHRLTRGFGGWVSIGGESSASPDSTVDMASPDGTRILSSGGLELEPVRDLRILLECNIQGILAREVRSSDYDLGNGIYKLRLYTLSAYLDITL